MHALPFGMETLWKDDDETLYSDTICVLARQKEQA
jgi:hypothetical protein